MHPITPVPPNAVATLFDEWADSLVELERALRGLASELRDVRDLGREVIGLPPVFDQASAP